MPLWIRHPGIAGPTVDQLLGNVDLATTFAEIAGIDVNKPFVGFRHFNEWVFEQLLSPADTEIEAEYYSLDTSITGGPFELVNGYQNLTPTRLAQLQHLATNYGECSGASCRVYDSQNI